MEEILIYRHYLTGDKRGKRVRHLVTNKYTVEDVKKWKIYRIKGIKFFPSARKITERDKASDWYKAIHFIKDKKYKTAILIRGYNI